MKGFQLGLKPKHTYEQFVAAGADNFKQLPPGWKFRIKTGEGFDRGASNRRRHDHAGRNSSTSMTRPGRACPTTSRRHSTTIGWPSAVVWNAAPPRSVRERDVGGTLWFRCLSLLSVRFLYPSRSAKARMRPSPSRIHCRKAVSGISLPGSGHWGPQPTAIKRRSENRSISAVQL